MEIKLKDLLDMDYVELLDRKDREAIEKEYQKELMVKALKEAWRDFAYSCGFRTEDSYGNHGDSLDPFDWRVIERVVGDAEKYKTFKKLMESFND